jgi:hypothetical protein
MSELNIADIFITETLLASLGVTNVVSNRVVKVTKPGTAYPMVRFNELAAKDSNGSGAQRISTSTLYLVRAIGQGSGFLAIDTVADAIDTALHGVQYTATGGSVLCCLREQPFEKYDVDGETTYYSRGGIYRIIVH